MTSILNCRLLEISLGCSITIEYEKLKHQEDVQCLIRFHGRHRLSPPFPFEMTRDDRMQMNFVYNDVGEIIAIEIELLSKKDVGLNIKWIEINIPKKSFFQRYNVYRWLHSTMYDGRTRLLLTSNQLPTYLPKRHLELLEIHKPPERDYVKYMLLIEISKIRGPINESILSIDLIGRYGRTSMHRINMKHKTNVPVLCELAMLDVGTLQEYEINFDNQSNDSAIFISNIYIYRKQYYEINIQQWIENAQTLNGHIRLSNMPAIPTLFNESQSKSSFIVWITGSNSIEKDIILPVEFQLLCQQNTLSNSVQETITIRNASVSVLALSASCTMPLNSIVLKYNRKFADYCIIKEVVLLNVFQGQYTYFHYDNELPKSMDDIDAYLFVVENDVYTSSTKHSKHYIVSILTSENNLSEKHTLKIVLRGERGFTSMLLLHNSSWNNVPFKAKQKDKFLLLASDIGKIKGFTMFHTGEDAKFYFDIVEIFVPDTKSCIRLQGKYEIFNEIIDFNCHESTIVYIVQIKSGYSTINETVDIVLTLTGEESSIEWLLLSVDNDTKPFRTGQLDTFYVPTKRLGKIRGANVNCSNMMNLNLKWFCEMIYVHDPVFNIKSNFVINRWCGDHQQFDVNHTLNRISKTNLIQLQSNKLLTTFMMKTKTGVRTIINPMLTPSLYVIFAGQYGSSPIIHLNALTDRVDLFQSLEIDEFCFTIPDTGMPNIMRIWNVEELAPWTCEYVDIHNINNSKSVHFPMDSDLQKVDPFCPPYVDLEVDIGRVSLELPGPRYDTAYPSYQIMMSVDQSMNTETDVITVQIVGENDQSKLIQLIENNKFTFHLYGICPLGELKEISIHTQHSWGYVVVYDYFNNKYYATKKNANTMNGKYKLSTIKNMDWNHLNEELDRIESELTNEQMQITDPIYRIIYKTQINPLTNLTRNAQVFIQLMGSEESTSFFALQRQRPVFSGSINESFYQRNQSIDGLNKINIQLIDNERTRWACESIEIQNLLTDEIFIFPINDVLESSLKIDDRITTWRSGFKSGIAYLVQIRTGYQGASFNFRFGSVHLSLKLYGDSGVSNDLPLHIPYEQLHYLKCNQTDTFEIGQPISMVGQVNSIDLHHNGKKEDFWHINWIHIIDLTTNKSFHFPIEKHLNKDVGTAVNILHIPATVAKKMGVNDTESVPNYVIRIKTGKQTPVHTEDIDELPVVSVVLIDSVNDSPRIPLKRMNATVRSIFQPDQEDRFEITQSTMLELKLLQIYFNGTFPWYCEQILVTDQISGFSYRFDVEQWFTENTIDRPVNVFGQREDKLSGWIYSVTIKTQAVLPAQTNLRGKILLSIYGEHASLNDAILGSGRLMHGLFHAGGEDMFELKSAKRLGEINSIELRLEVAEWQSWFCETIEIVDLAAHWDFLSRTMLTKTYKFPINRWLGTYSMDKRTTIHSLINQEPGYAKMPTYIIHVLTGSKTINNESDLPINVYLQLFCAQSNHVYGPILLDKSSNNTHPFRKGQIDEFYINDVSYCNEIKKIRLWHDGGKVASWHCEWIKITNVSKNEIYEFTVEKILDEDLEEGSSNLILSSEQKDEINESEPATPQSIIM